MHARVCVCMKCVGGGGHEHVWPIPASSRRPARQPCQGPAALCVPRLVIAVAPCVCSATGQVPCYLPTGGSPCCPSCSSSAPLAPTHPHLHSKTHLPAATHSTDKRRHPERQGPAAGQHRALTHVQHRALTHVQHRAAGQLGRRPGTAPATTLRGGGPAGGGGGRPASPPRGTSPGKSRCRHHRRCWRSASGRLCWPCWQVAAGSLSSRGVLQGEEQGEVQ